MLQVSTLGVPNTDEYKGRIIKLGIMCSSNIFSWLLFKYVGNFNCKFVAAFVFVFVFLFNKVQIIKNRSTRGIVNITGESRGTSRNRSRRDNEVGVKSYFLFFC